jgi:hypothetical protein
MICKNLKKIRKQIELAAERSGRSPDSVQLIAISKRQNIEKIKEAVSCGQLIFGENYLLEAKQKKEHLPGDKNICYHFTGHLQSNKARLATEIFDVIETVDRVKIARLIDRHCTNIGREVSILVQVNIGRERQKHGVLPENTKNLLCEIKKETNLKVIGLMTMVPKTDDPESSRPYFKAMRQLADILSDNNLFTPHRKIELSMGMSADFEIAIEEGATMVRVGTALFGTRE